VTFKTLGKRSPLSSHPFRPLIRVNPKAKSNEEGPPVRKKDGGGKALERVLHLCMFNWEDLLLVQEKNRKPVGRWKPGTKREYGLQKG